MLGQSLNHYRIIEKLGAGGMGEVYRAEDARLGREVAIKLLPVGLAADLEVVARLRREARVLASLNHPNIAQIYGLEETGEGRLFLVLELVGGETLDQRLRRAPLSASEALDLALQLAGALETAHDQRIVHRDLKPGNLRISSDGSLKVLDFGIANARPARRWRSCRSSARREAGGAGMCMRSRARRSWGSKSCSAGRFARLCR